MKTAYFPWRDCERLLMRAIVEELVRQGWDREGITITAVDPFGDGVNGYEAVQGTIGAQLLGAQADEANH